MLARDLLYEGFNVRNIWAIFARDGVSQDRLELHIKDPIQHGPKLRNTRIDKYAPDTKTMKQTPWNRALVHKFAAKANDIVANCIDKRFGPDTIDWVRLFSDRFYDIFKQVIKARRQPGESHEARILRLVLDDNNRKERNSKVSLRHAVRDSHKLSMNGHKH
ncbi:hypothetical protein F5050DRAFT_1561442 [Lentinula boryana]|uniref:Uncharacterized protein n=1 Tax=Lentinula boryana TaxID=40481 RepID=A0ABQ8QRE8_9AGAR|nr:hypothetical protein F5050DRAFT_1561442 [Lentinula boryana]